MATASGRGRQLRKRLERLFETPGEPTTPRWRIVTRATCVVTVLALTVITALAWPTVSDVRRSVPVESPISPLLAALGDRQPVPGLEFRSRLGRSIDLENLRGNVVLVSFWDATCRFCEKDVEGLKALRNLFSGDSFAVVGVSISRTVEGFEGFVEEHDINWPQRHEHERWSGDAARAFDVRAVPSHYVIDREGRSMHVPLGRPLDRVIAALLEE